MALAGAGISVRGVVLFQSTVHAPTMALYAGQIGTASADALPHAGARASVEAENGVPLARPSPSRRVCCRTTAGRDTCATDLSSAETQ